MFFNPKIAIYWTIVLFLPHIWPINSGFVNLKKVTTMNKSGTIQLNAMLEILSDDVKKINSQLDVINEKLDNLESKFSYIWSNRNFDKTTVRQDENLSLHHLLINGTITKFLNNLDMELLKNKLERVTKIQERNSQLLVIEMSSLTNLEESINRLENLIIPQESKIFEKNSSLSTSSCEKYIEEFFRKIDNKLDDVMSMKSKPQINESGPKKNGDDEKIFSSENSLEVLNEEKTTRISNKLNKTVRGCDSLRNNKNYPSGIYFLDKKEMTMKTVWGNATRVNCDQERDFGGWTIIQRRSDSYGGRVDFNKSWDEYTNGFGDLDGEFWFGNEIVHRMTFYYGQYELRIELEDWEGETAWAEYSYFELGTRTDGYRIKISGYTGNATDSLSAHYSTPFSTYDRRNDFAPRCCPCTSDYGGGWWYYSCFEANLNGDYYGKDDYRKPYRGIIWEHWRDDYSLKSTKMMIRLKEIYNSTNRNVH